jgi:prepilin-type N-terminal cleavage/methylation domain-containing protein
VRRGSQAADRPRAVRDGYTVVEVMMALAVLTLGATGVVAMQKATIISNNHARNLVTANAIAQSWMERLRTDALSWNEPALVPDLGDTQWLKLANNGPAIPTGWFSPSASTLKGSQPAGTAFGDLMGADQFAGDTMATAFCTQIRLTRFANNTAVALGSYYRMIRAEVRVYWSRSGQPLDCAVPPPVGFDAEIGKYGFVYIVSAVLENPAPL